MCGIAGILSKNGQPPRVGDLNKMCHVIAHRGPDDSGIYSNGPVVLGHRRLAILDLSAAGHQPMTTMDGRYTIVFNGEIYNYRELADRFLPDVKLRSSSDTEVLLHLLARRGMAVLPELRGMFAFAFWDAQEQTLCLAQDPFGKKPLYVREDSAVWSFASELKALIAHGSELDHTAMAQYFLYEYVPTPRTPFKNISQLPRGHYCLIKGTTKQVVKWWEPTFLPKITESFEATVARFDQLLNQAVARRLISDVPVGIFLSGGIDSTTIAWYMRQHVTGEFHSFSVSFREPSFDETPYAQLAARHLGTQHHQLHFSLAAFTQTLQQVVPLLDTPLGDASILPTTAISRLARESITVVLDGDGSDELLGGYGIFSAATIAEQLNLLPNRLWRHGEVAAALLPTSYRNFSWDFKIKSFLRGLGYSLPHRHQIWLGSFSPLELTELLAPRWRETTANVFEPIDQLQEKLRHLTPPDQVSLLLLQGYLADDLLVKLDRATMMASVEARTPFLDVDFAAFAMRLPTEWKRNKNILKHVMAGRIPEAIIRRSKKGFGIPLGWWLKGPLYEWAAHVLEPGKLLTDDIINPHVPLRLLAEHRRGTADHRKKLWTLLAWQLWYDHWIAKRTTPLV